MDERLYSIALTLCKGIDHRDAKFLVDSVGSAAEVFAQRKSLPDIIPSVSPQVVDALDNEDAFERAKRELEFVEQKNIRCITLSDADYPNRLRACCDAPIVLFCKGNADFNRKHVISMVGTRRCTDYGKQFCQRFVKELAQILPDVMIVSGLAYGIDIHSHREALANGLSTVGVLAHGLDRIYPSMHRQTAIEMLQNGGLLTEYLTGTNPDKLNFLARNRIVAGLADATVVVESPYRGGSMSTATLTVDYGRTCFAVPGRITDESSEGCNILIRQNKAVIMGSVDDFMQEMQWKSQKAKKKEPLQQKLFPDLTPNEQAVVDALTGIQEPKQINQLAAELNKSISSLSSTLFSLEMRGIVKALVGSNYRLV